MFTQFSINSYLLGKRGLFYSFTVFVFFFVYMHVFLFQKTYAKATCHNRKKNYFIKNYFSVLKRLKPYKEISYKFLTHTHIYMQCFCNNEFKTVRKILCIFQNKNYIKISIGKNKILFQKFSKKLFPHRFVIALIFLPLRNKGKVLKIYPRDRCYNWDSLGLDVDKECAFNLFFKTRIFHNTMKST